MTTVEHTAFASPLSLLASWRNDLPDGPPLRELLILGYTLDLPFLERFAVPVARQLGARVTVLTDAGQVVSDPVDVRFAGRTYQHGLAALDGAFHPKLAVLVGDEHLWAAIGSGNPTMSGWGHNHELWCVLRGRLDRGPAVQAALGDWLRELPARVAMPSWVAATVAELGVRIRPTVVDGSHPGVRLLHNLDRAVIDQVGFDVVSELRLGAPFIDSSGAAVRALIDRARPDRVRMALQMGMTPLVGRTLVAATDRVTDVEFRNVDDHRRTLHGKLVEWAAADGTAIALVGSPNLTTPALLETVASGGNCELAVCAPVAQSLLPEATPIGRDEVAAHVVERPVDRDHAAGLRLLGCRRVDDGLSVELLTRHSVAVTVETSVDASPGSWQARAVVPAASLAPTGPTVVRVEAPEIVGGAVRVTATLGGVRVESAPVFVTDTTRCRPRTDPGDAPRLRREYGIDELITDPDLATRFSRDLLRLLDLSARNRAPQPALRRTTVEGAATAEVDRWQRFLDVVAYSVGPSLTELIFPGALPTPDRDPVTTWTLGSMSDERELADGESDATVDDVLADAAPQEARRVPPSARGRYRTWMRRWVGAVGRSRSATAQPALMLRMTVTALYVELLAAGVWGADDGWRTDLADLVEALVADPVETVDTPAEVHGPLAAHVAVCLALLVQDASLHGGRPVDVVARRAWEAGHGTAAAAEPVVVEAMLLRSGQPDARLVGPGEVDDVVRLAREAVSDPHAEAVAGLVADGFTVERRNGAWIVQGEFRNATRLAARAATELAEADGVMVVATTGKAATVMVRHGADLAMAESSMTRWRLYTLRAPTTPASLFRGADGLPTTRHTEPLRPVPAAIVELGRKAGGDVVALVNEFLKPQLRRPSRPTPTWDW